MGHSTFHTNINCFKDFRLTFEVIINLAFLYFVKMPLKNIWFFKTITYVFFLIIFSIKAFFLVNLNFNKIL